MQSEQQIGSCRVTHVARGVTFLRASPTTAGCSACGRHHHGPRSIRRTNHSTRCDEGHQPGWRDAHVQQAESKGAAAVATAHHGGHPRVYTEELLLLDWLLDWPVLAVACGLPRDAQGCLRVPRPAPQCKRTQQAGAPRYELLFVVVVRRARHIRLVGGRDVISGSAPILAWRRADPAAAVGHAPHHHARPLLRGYRVHTLLCRGSGVPLPLPLPLLFLLSPANVHDAPFARPLLAWALRRPHPRAVQSVPAPAPAPRRLDRPRNRGRADLHRYARRRLGRPAGRTFRSHPFPIRVLAHMWEGLLP